VAKERKRRDIVSVELSPQGKAELDKACANRGMTIKALLGRLITWFVTLDRTEQAIVLGQVETRHVRTLADLIGRRRPK